MATGREYPIWAAVRGITDGLSATATLKAYRSGGGRIATQTWYRLWSEAKEGIAAKTGEVGRPQNRRPLGSELVNWTTVGASGYLQQVEILTRNRLSNEIEVKFYSITGNTLVSRAKATSDALDLYEANADEYGEQVLGALHVGAFRLSPGDPNLFLGDET